MRAIQRFGLLFLSVTAVLPAQEPAETPAAEGMPRYKQCIKRLAFRFHVAGRLSLARRGDAEALRTLIGDYRKPQKVGLGLPPNSRRQLPLPKVVPQDYARYTLATMFGKYFNDVVSVELLETFKHEFPKPADAWLWCQVLTIEAKRRGPDKVMKIATGKHPLHHRAAALYGLARAQAVAVLDVLPEICANLPKRPGERRMLLGPISDALLVGQRILKDASMQKALRAYIGLLEPDVKLTHSAKMVVARHLGKVFGKPVPYIEPAPWIRILESGQEPPKRSGQTVSGMRFFGVEAEGDRICYVIDMSNSMCKKIAPELIPKGPVTGPRKKRKRRKGQLPDESDIPWHRVKTRFDLAREHLKISLQRLGKDKRFCVVAFGTMSRMLKSCKGMIKATRGNVRRVIKELDAIRPGAPMPPDAPDGVLEGNTNLHAGMRRAFALRSKGFAARHEHVDKKALAEGCDTIFLLSDGAPKWDDFYVSDEYYAGEGQIVRDTEYGEKATRTDNIVYHGPYDQTPWLDDDVRRMNMFRKVQIHCIGIGEADERLLRRIAADADGEVFFVGRKKK